MSDSRREEKLGRIWVPKEAGLVPTKERVQVMLFILIHANRCPGLSLSLQRAEKCVCGGGAGVQVDKR